MDNMTSKLSEKKSIRINGVLYLLQMVSASWYLGLMDTCKDDNGNLKQGDYMNRLVAAVVISPKDLTMDDFTGKIYAWKRLVKACEEFVLGEDVDIEDVEEKNVENPDAENVLTLPGFSTDQS